MQGGCQQVCPVSTDGDTAQGLQGAICQVVVNDLERCQHLLAKQLLLFGVEIRSQQCRLRFGASSFESSESRMLTSEQESVDERASQSAAGVEVVDLILTEEEAGS